MWLLIVYYMRAMIFLTSNFHDYYQSYYLANAGIELSLIQVKNRWYAFARTVQSGDALISSNFPWINQSLTYTIQSSGTVFADENTFWLFDCSLVKNYKKLENWEPIILPLLQDMWAWWSPISFSWVVLWDYQEFPRSLSIKVFASGANAMGKVLFWVIETNTFSITSASWTSDQNIINNSSATYNIQPLWALPNYIAFLNTSTGPWTRTFCLEISAWWSIPLPLRQIRSTARYNRAIVTLQWFKRSEIPWDFLYTAIATQ